MINYEKETMIDGQINFYDAAQLKSNFEKFAKRFMLPDYKCRVLGIEKLIDKKNQINLNRGRFPITT